LQFIRMYCSIKKYWKVAIGHRMYQIKIKTHCKKCKNVFSGLIVQCHLNSNKTVFKAVLRIGYVYPGSWILNPDFFSIPDPTTIKKEGKKIVILPFL
jgi:hypothetical protein